MDGQTILSDGKMILLSAVLVFILAYVVYEILDSTKHLKKERILAGTKYFEKKIESTFKVEKISALKKYRSLVKELVPGDKGLNVYMIIAFALVIAYFVFDMAKDFLAQIPAALLMAGIAFSVPFLFLDIFATYNRNRVRERLPHFLLMFQQTHRTTGDTLSALATMKGRMKDPIAGFIKEFMKNIQRNADYKEATDILKERTDNEVFKAFADIIYMDLEYGKMIEVELDNVIKSAFVHVENYSQRITENSGNLASIGLVLLLFATGVQRLLNINDEFLYIIRNNVEGKILVNVVIAMLVVVFYLIKKSIAYQDK